MQIRRESALNDVRNSELLFENINFFFSPDGFSGDGCYVDPIKSNSEDTVCKCNHLTHFAVLVDFSGGPEVFFYCCCNFLLRDKCVGSINPLFILTLP